MLSRYRGPQATSSSIGGGCEEGGSAQPSQTRLTLDRLLLLDRARGRCRSHSGLIFSCPRRPFVLGRGCLKSPKLPST